MTDKNDSDLKTREGRAAMRAQVQTELVTAAVELGKAKRHYEQLLYMLALLKAIDADSAAQPATTH